MRESLQTLRKLIQGGGKLVVFSGAGMSTESGIPDFRSPGGVWSQHQPIMYQDFLASSSSRRDYWRFYQEWFPGFAQATPHQGHLALGRLYEAGVLKAVVTQNVDGLHPRAGGAPERTYEIHGNLQVHRCMNDCTQELWPCPASVYAKEKDEPLSAADEQALRCPRCGAWARPHVLWFDECYDEAHFRFNSSLEAVASADLLLIVGTTGATNLPMQMGVLAARSGAALVDVNPSPNPFATLAKRTGGFALQGKAGDLLPPIADALEA